MLTKTNFEIAKITGKDSVLLINDKYTVANDGRRLIEVSRPLNQEMPDIEGFQETRKTNDIIINRKSSLGLSKKITAESKDELKATKVARISNNGSLKIATMDKSINPEIVTITPEAGQYPSYKQVIPKNEDSITTFAINPKFLKEVMDLMDKFQFDDYKRCYVHVYNSCIKIRTYNRQTKQKMQAVIMNMSIDSKKDALRGQDKITIDDICDSINKARNKRQGDPGYICAHYTFESKVVIVRVLPEDTKECTKIIFKGDHAEKAIEYLKDIKSLIIN